MAQGSVRIGRIAGINIELHWLFILLILIFIAWNPLLGFVWILLFVCVLIHELSHSITATRNGIKVSKIILLPIGGASIINDLGVNPAAEMNISLAGPLMSFVLGGIFGILVIFAPAGLITYLLQYLFVINILLGIFNILPAFPMDGGRVLRSYLQKKNDFYHATMTTVKVSKYCMALIVVATVIFVIVPSSYSVGYRELIFLWDLIIVFFLYEGAKAEEESATVKHETKGMTIKDAISKNYSVIEWESSPKRLYEIIKRKKEHIILTQSPEGDYQLVNIFDRKAIAGADSISRLAVQIPNIQASTSIYDTMQKIEGTGFRVAAVFKGRTLLGIVTWQYMNAFLTLHMAGKSLRKGLNK